MKFGFVGVFLERTKYRIRVGRGLAPAVNLHRTPRRGQAPALPYKLYFVRIGNGLDRSANLPTCWGGGARKARDGGANHIKIRGRTQFAPTSREQPLCCSAKLHQNLRAGVETRPYKRARGDPPDCHSEPIGEESRFAHFILGFEILRFAQDDKNNPQFIGIARLRI